MPAREDQAVPQGSQVRLPEVPDRASPVPPGRARACADQGQRVPAADAREAEGRPHLWRPGEAVPRLLQGGAPSPRQDRREPAAHPGDPAGQRRVPGGLRRLPRHGSPAGTSRPLRGQRTQVGHPQFPGVRARHHRGSWQVRRYDTVRCRSRTGRRALRAGLCASDNERCHLYGLATNLDDVVLGHPETGDVHLVSVDHEVAVTYQLASHVAGGGEARPVHDVVQPGLQDAQQVLAGLAGATVRLLEVTAELLLQDAIDAGGLLLLTHLKQVLAVLGPGTAVHARWVRAKLDRALRGVALGPLEVQLGLLATAAPAVSTGITRHKSLSPLAARGQTRRRLDGRTPLCGVGVTSLIAPTSRPVAVSERIAVSRPEPGPLTKTSTLRMPCSMARRAAASAAICAANGVDLREPLKPTWPAEAHAITFPMGSVIETMVLLNVLLM